MTTSMVLGESWTLLRRWLGQRAAVLFIASTRRSSSVVVHQVESDDEAEAWVAAQA